MANVTSAVFNKKAVEKLRSPDDLEKYVRVTNPSVWVILAACLALVVGLLAWGVFGSVTTNVATKGAVVNGKAICFLDLDDVETVHVGDAATVNGKPVKIAEVSKTPLSRDEAREVLGSDYLLSTLVSENWGYQVTFAEDGGGSIDSLEPNIPFNVSITVDRISPISLVFGVKA